MSVREREEVSVGYLTMLKGLTLPALNLSLSCAIFFSKKPFQGTAIADFVVRQSELVPLDALI